MDGRRAIALKGQGVSEASAVAATNGRSNGPRRSQVSHDAILAATMELLAEVGYSDLTIEGIASRAGVGKATIYRWWSSKSALVGETLARHLQVESIKESGSLRNDLRKAVAATVENYSNSIAGVVVPGLLADIVHDPDLHDSFRKQFIEPRRASVARLVQRAVDEGALPIDTDTDLVMDIWAGAVFYQVIVTGRAISDDLPDALVSLILDGEVPRRRASTKGSGCSTTRTSRRG